MFLITVCLLPLGAAAAARAGERDEKEKQRPACCAVRCLSPAPERRSKSVRHEATDLLPVASLFSSTMSHLYQHVSTLPLAVRLRDGQADT